MHFRNYRLQETYLDKYLKSLVSAHRSTFHMLKGPKNCSNLRGITFIKFTDHSEGRGVGNCLS